MALYIIFVEQELAGSREAGVEPVAEKTVALEVGGGVEAKVEAEVGAEDDLANYPGVNMVFLDSPEIQIGWMNRASDVINNNLPPYADSAEVRETFFHRGDRDWAATCGEVEFHRDGDVAQDYQRFIYAGVQTVYYELEIQNFDLFWEKMCIARMPGTDFNRK